MVKRKVTLSIDTDIYKDYRSYCEDHALVLSKKVELFMNSELKKQKDTSGGFSE